MYRYLKGQSNDLGRPMAIPQELIDAILVNLSGDIGTLKETSLVSSSFLPTSQRLIFSHVQILSKHPDEPGSIACDRFSKLLSSSPHIASLIRHLSIDAGDDKPWVLSSQTSLPQLLSTLLDAPESRFQAISFYFRGLFFKLNWSDLPPSLSTALRDTFRSPQIRAISLGGIAFQNMGTLSDLFEGCDGLEDLTLSGVSVPQPDDLDDTIFIQNSASSATILNTRPKPMSLTLASRVIKLSTGSGCWLLQRPNVFDLSRLRDLCVRVKNNEDCQYVWALLHQTKTTLKNLNLQFTYECKRYVSFAYMQFPDKCLRRRLRVTSSASNLPSFFSCLSHPRGEF
jgi:hypothetical protein